MMAKTPPGGGGGGGGPGGRGGRRGARGGGGGVSLREVGPLIDTLGQLVALLVERSLTDVLTALCLVEPARRQVRRQGGDVENREPQCRASSPAAAWSNSRPMPRPRRSAPT